MGVLIEYPPEEEYSIGTKLVIDKWLLLILFLGTCINRAAERWLQQQNQGPHLKFRETRSWIFALLLIIAQAILYNEFFGLGKPYFRLIRFFIPFIPGSGILGAPLVKPHAQCFAGTSQELFVANIHLAFGVCSVIDDFISEVIFAALLLLLSSFREGQVTLLFLVAGVTLKGLPLD